VEDRSGVIRCKWTGIRNIIAPKAMPGIQAKGVARGGIKEIYSDIGNIKKR
jgi:hypothetical protein